MPTIQDALDIHKAFCQSAELFGFTEDAPQQFNTLFLAVGEAIMQENDTDKHTALALPHDTPLGPLATEKYQELKTWWDGNPTNSAQPA